MRFSARVGAVVVGAMAAGGLGLAAPAMATTAPASGPTANETVPAGLPALPTPCTYNFDPASMTFSGSCDFVLGKGSFSGKYDPTTKKVSGTVSSSNPLGSYEGTFTASGTPGSPISGTYTLKPANSLPTNLPLIALPS